MKIFRLKESVDGGTEDQRAAVKAIINDVRINGDFALKQYTEKFDGITLSTTLVSEEEISEAFNSVESGAIGDHQGSGSKYPFLSRKATPTIPG